MLVKLGLTRWINAAAIVAATLETGEILEYDRGEDGRIELNGYEDAEVGSEYSYVNIYLSDAHSITVIHPVEVEAAIALLDSLTETY